MTSRSEESTPYPRLRLGAELEQIAEQLKALARAQDKLHELYEAVLGRQVELPWCWKLIVSTAMELTGARYGALGVLDADGTQLALFVPWVCQTRRRPIWPGWSFPAGAACSGT